MCAHRRAYWRWTLAYFKYYPSSLIQNPFIRWPRLAAHPPVGQKAPFTSKEYVSYNKGSTLNLPQPESCSVYINISAPLISASIHPTEPFFPSHWHQPWQKGGRITCPCYACHQHPRGVSEDGQLDTDSGRTHHTASVYTAVLCLGNDSRLCAWNNVHSWYLAVWKNHGRWDGARHTCCLQPCWIWTG